MAYNDIRKKKTEYAILKEFLSEMLKYLNITDLIV